MDHIRKIRKNCFTVLLEQYKGQLQTAKMLAEQCAGGNWLDINYADQNRSNWAPAQHLIRLRFMAAVWSNPEDPFFHHSDLADGLRRGIEFWSEGKFFCDNWWWNEIFVPITAGHIFILAGKALQGAQWLEKIMPSLLQGKFNYTGQNRIWCAEAVLLRAILTADPKLISAARKEILAEIVFAKSEGIKVDGSFHQHGPQLQFGNYGLSYSASIANFTAYFHNTQWALTELDPFRTYINDGIKWVLWRNVMDLSAQGRQVGKDTQTVKRSAVQETIAKMIKYDPVSAKEYKKEPVGNKMFFTSDFMVHRSKNFYASYHANSVRTYTTETYINKDNLSGKYLSDGMTQIMRSGQEYLNIAGCWSWTRLPGTTLPDTMYFSWEENPSESTNPPDQPYKRLAGESVFTGGVSDGKKYGAMIHTMNLDKVKANKAVFFADNIIIALGSGIESESPCPVATTVEQSLLNGEIHTGDQCFYHNGIGYSGKNITLFSGLRQGDWQPTWGGYTSPQPDEKEIFQLTIEHGTNIKNGYYEYAVYPDSTWEEMPALMRSYQVLENSTKIQAVKLANDTIMAIFHRPGKLGNFSTDAPGVFILDKKRIFAADPTHKKRIFNLKLNHKAYKIVLPKGQFAGSTVSVAK